MRRPIIYEDEKQQRIRIRRRASALRSAEKRRYARLAMEASACKKAGNSALDTQEALLRNKAYALRKFIEASARRRASDDALLSERPNHSVANTFARSLLLPQG